MRKLFYFLIITIINTGLLQARQKTPVVTEEQDKPVFTKALQDTIQERLKLSRRYSANSRSTNFKLARRHVNRVVQLNDSLQLNNADYLVAAGDVEDLAFNYERNKPALGGKTDEAACLAAAKQCYIYYRKAFDLYRADADRYGKLGKKQQLRIQQIAMQYFLLTNGFQVNAGQSFKKGNLKQTLEEFRMTYDGSTSPFLCELYKGDTKRNASFETFLADSTQCKALFNCATVSSALGNLDESLAYYDSLKVRGYSPDKVYRNTIAIYSSRQDTVQIVSELEEAIKVLPEDTWFQKNLLQICLDKQNWKQAELVADRCLKVDSMDAQTLGLRGQLYELRGEVDKALVAYLRSYDIDSMQSNVCSYVGRIHYNKAVQLRKQLYDQRRFKEIDDQIQPIYEEALPWYERAYRFDELRKDEAIPKAIREILYSRFTKAQCPNRTELIALYNEVSKAYGLAEFGK